jgi:hypothetical protein
MAIAPASSGASRRLGNTVRANPARSPEHYAHQPTPLGLPPSLHHLRLPGIAAQALFGSFFGTTQQSDFPEHDSSPYAYWLLDALCALRRRSILGSPGSRARCFRACMRSQTAQGPCVPRQSGTHGVAFGVATPLRRPRLSQRLRAGGLFRGSIPSLRVPLSTLRLYRCRHRRRMTQGPCRWLNFQRMTLSFTTPGQSSRRTWPELTRIPRGTVAW